MHVLYQLKSETICTMQIVQIETIFAIYRILHSYFYYFTAIFTILHRFRFSIYSEGETAVQNISEASFSDAGNLIRSPFMLRFQ